MYTVYIWSWPTLLNCASKASALLFVTATLIASDYLPQYQLACSSVSAYLSIPRHEVQAITITPHICITPLPHIAPWILSPLLHHHQA